jgi:hypothetical protein
MLFLRRFLLGCLLATGFEASAQEFKPNYDEAAVPAYSLPDPLVAADGTVIDTPELWRTKRRPELLELFREQMYGRAPGKPAGMRFEVVESSDDALGGKATRKQVTIHLTENTGGPKLHLLLYVPNERKGPAPAFIGLNFSGNHVVHSDPAILLTDRWVRDDNTDKTDGNRAAEAARGSQATNWMVERLIERGYAIGTVYYGDIEPDHPEGWRDGVRSVFPVDGKPVAKPAAKTITEFRPDHWGAIAAWAWGLSRVLDYLETDPDIDAKRVAVMGHSRLGKTALWAAAEDERFALCVSNNSGEGGAAIARRRFGETTWRINNSFPHWFCGNFKQFNNQEDKLPFDQHELIALIAPRPVYVASASEDQWADPKGEFLAAVNAELVYALLGKVGLGVTSAPSIDQPIGKTIGYHLRTGEHAVLPYDWERYLDFADREMAAGEVKE